MSNRLAASAGLAAGGGGGAPPGRPSALRHRRGVLDLSAPRVMGVLNVTPDSFSDGGCWLEPGRAIERGLAMVGAGAALVDVGGESTRPGAEPVSPEEEARRVLPVVEALARRGVLVSIDTRRPEIARDALAAGAAIVNDVEGLRQEAMRREAAAAGAGVVLMHMQGSPETMQRAPRYGDVVAEVCGFLRERVAAAVAAGIAPEAIAIDPGIGFGKTDAHNLSLLTGIETLAGLGHPVLVGVSRKSFLGRLLGGRPPEKRMAASVSAALFAAAWGAAILRVHDVEATVDALRVWAALAAAGPLRPRST